MFRSKGLVLFTQHLKHKARLTRIVAGDQSGIAPKASRLSILRSPAESGRSIVTKASEDDE